MAMLSIENLNWFICNIKFPLKAPSSPLSHPLPSQGTRGKKKFLQHHGGGDGESSAFTGLPWDVFSLSAFHLCVHSSLSTCLDDVWSYTFWWHALVSLYFPLWYSDYCWPVLPWLFLSPEMQLHPPAKPRLRAALCYRKAFLNSATNQWMLWS